MTAWRPITGTITRLDTDLTSDADIQALFEEERILGRGRPNPENPAQFDIELAIAGRKRRVATLDESDEIFKGRSLENLAAHIHATLRKVEVSIAGKVLHGPMDIGAVDIDDAECEVDSGADAHTPCGSDLPQGRGFALADIATSEIPMLATAHNQPIASMRVNDLKLLIFPNAPECESLPIPSPDYSLVFLIDNANRPLLVVSRMGRQSRWDWTGEMPSFSWVNKPCTAETARNFVHDELGAGGMARLAVADMVDATFAAVREALLSPRESALSALVNALGLPTDVLGVIDGTISVQSVPELKIFEPRGTAGAFTEALAWEMAGQGRINSSCAQVIRAVYLKRPWLTSMVAAAQAGIGGAVLMSGMHKQADKPRSTWKIAVGGLLVATAISRIATIQYVSSAMDRFVGGEGD